MMIGDTILLDYDVKGIYLTHIEPQFEDDWHDYHEYFIYDPQDKILTEYYFDLYTFAQKHL